MSRAEALENSTQSHRKHIGIILVHGIGEQKPGEFIGQFLHGFRLLFGNDRVSESTRQDPAQSDRKIHAATIELEDRTVSLYEVHWADLIPPALARGSVDPEQLFAVAWFPWINRCVPMPGFEGYSRRRVWWWTFCLVLLSVLFWLGTTGLRALPNLARAWESLASMIWRADQARKPTGKDRRLHRRRVRRMDMPLHDLMASERRTWFDRLLDRYAGDVVNYVVSAAGLPRLREDIKVRERALCRLLEKEKSATEVAGLRAQLLAESVRRGQLAGLADGILARFARTAWVAVEEDRCSELQVLGHSLGSVIAYHALSGGGGLKDERGKAGMSEAAPIRARLTHLHTIGSPLEKVHFFWPSLVTTHCRRPAIRIQGPDGRTFMVGGDPTFEWNNFYSRTDLVSGKLERYQVWGSVKNHKIPGLGGLFTSHVSYKANSRFLQALGTALGTHAMPGQDAVLHRMAARAWSFLQGALFPTALAAVCLLGAAVVAGMGIFASGVITLAAWGVVSLIRLIQNDWLAGWSALRFFLWTAGFFGFVMLAMGIAFMPRWGKRVARMSIARFWKKPRGARDKAAAVEPANHATHTSV